MAEWGHYYYTRRSHMECGHLPPTCKQVSKAVHRLPRDKIEVWTYLGWLVQSFEWNVA